MSDLPAISANRRRAILGMLCVIYALNYIDRQIIVILQEPIKADFQLKDWHLGLLTGGAFAVVYAGMWVPIAHWVDRGARRTRLIALMLLLWSVMTVLCGMARGYGQFVLARMGVGVAEAGFSPTSHALISDLYSAVERPRALGVFAAGVPIGIMVGLAIGGLLAEWMSWRFALLVVGLPGILAALIFLLVAREPKRGGADPGHDMLSPSGSQMSLVKAMGHLAKRRPFMHVIAGTAVTALVQLAIMAWMPSFILRTYDMTLSQVGVGVGLVAGIGGIAGALLGGWQGSYFGRRGMHCMLFLPIIGLALCIPCYFAVLHAPSGYAALWLLLPPTILSGLWAAPAIALTQNLAPVALRARASALRAVASNLVGLALGPLLTGVLSDRFAASSGSAASGLKNALIIMVLLFVWAIFHWSLAILALRREDADYGSNPATRLP